MITPEEIRHEIVAHFYDRRGVSQDATTIRRHLARNGTDATLEAVTTEAEFLVGLGWLATDHDPLGATKYFHITSMGVLEYERSRH